MEKCRLSDVRRKLARIEHKHMYLNLTKSAFASRLGVNVCWALKKITLLFQQRKCNNVLVPFSRKKEIRAKKGLFSSSARLHSYFTDPIKICLKSKLNCTSTWIFNFSCSTDMATFRTSIRFYYNEFSGLDFAANRIGLLAMLFQIEILVLICNEFA